MQYPWLLQGGMYHRFRPMALVANLFTTDTPSADDNWRTVTVIRSSTPMQLPSAATLKKDVPDWNKTGDIPPVQVRWGTPELPEQESLKAQAPKLPESEKLEPKLTVPPPSAGQQVGNPQAPDTLATEAGVTPAGAAAKTEVADASPTGRVATVPLPAPTSKPVTKPLTEVPVTKPGGGTPTSVPAGIKPPAEAVQNPAQVFDNEQDAIRSDGSGLFGGEGFPLDEYANLIIERVKGNWLIPSNLRKSQGRTTVIFFIDKNGRSVNARIVTSSGSDSLDLAALSAVLGSNPFPPLPKGFPGDRVGAKFVFSYNERQ